MAYETEGSHLFSGRPSAKDHASSLNGSCLRHSV